MRHDWEDVHSELPITEGIFCRGYRRCKNCGKEQKREQTQNWGRVTGYQWWPLAGRCKGVRN